MAKMKRGVKTQAVRDYIAANPDANPKAIVAGLKSEGLTVKIGLVNSVKYNKRSRTRKGRAGRAPVVHAAARKTSSASMTIDQLIEVKQFADSLGGLAAFRQAIDMLEQLR
jgi:hypothetical protein